jgi:diguanylate cyclase (GGDEF)-like protein
MPIIDNVHPAVARALTARATGGKRLVVSLLTGGALAAPLWSPYAAAGLTLAVFAALILTVRVAAQQIVARDIAVARLLTERRDEADAAERARVALEQRFAEQATRDPLTGLLNRSALMTRIAALREDQRQSCTLLAVDIAQFAAFNERNGAGAADELLLAVSARVAGVLRPHDAVARIDGDVFAALLEGVPRELVQDVASRVVASVKTAYAVGGEVHVVDIACGLVTVAAGDPVDPAEVLRRADIALQNAKATQCPVVVFEPRLETDTRERLKFRHDLAAAQANHELYLVYQPLFDARTGAVHAVEALMRWHHPERGLVSPAEFIPIAESSGQIVEMGLWALAAACRQQRAWRTRDHADIVVAVNFSARQLSDPQVVDRVAEIVTREAFDPRRIKLEITESLVVEDIVKAIDVLTKLRALGLRLSVDDFGTGYSSLSRLGELPIDELKIDRYFVEGIGQQGPRETILTAAVAMGHGLGLTVVAEGVETVEQLDYLRAHGCDYIQGFLLGRPLQPEEALDAFASPPPSHFVVPAQRRSAGSAPELEVPSVLPSLERASGRRLFAR